MGDVEFPDIWVLGGGVKMTMDPITITTLITGDKDNPVSTLITGDKDNPVSTLITGDKDNPVSTLITGDKDNPVSTLITGDKDNPVSTLITGDSKKPVATTIDIQNIPHLSLNDIKDIMTPKLRVHMPNYEQVSFKLLGTEIFSICMSGEMQMITQPFSPNMYEKGEIKCPDEDTRPFPKTERFDLNKNDHSKVSVEEGK